MALSNKEQNHSDTNNSKPANSAEQTEERSPLTCTSLQKTTTVGSQAVCKKTQGFVGFNPLGSEEANISKTETE